MAADTHAFEEYSNTHHWTCTDSGNMSHMTVDSHRENKNNVCKWPYDMVKWPNFVCANIFGPEQKKNPGIVCQTNLSCRVSCICEYPQRSQNSGSTHCSISLDDTPRQQTRRFHDYIQKSKHVGKFWKFNIT